MSFPKVIQKQKLKTKIQDLETSLYVGDFNFLFFSTRNRYQLIVLISNFLLI